MNKTEELKKVKEGVIKVSGELAEMLSGLPIERDSFLVGQNLPVRTDGRDQDFLAVLIEAHGANRADRAV